MNVRRRGFPQIDLLGGHMELVPALGQAADEAVRHQAVPVWTVIGQQRRGVRHEDPEAHADIMHNSSVRCLRTPDMFATVKPGWRSAIL